jgi:hypothetical protein
MIYSHLSFSLPLFILTHYLHSTYLGVGEITILTLKLDGSEESDRPINARMPSGNIRDFQNFFDELQSE